MRVSKILRRTCGLCRETVVVDWDVTDRDRPHLAVWVRSKLRWRGRCGPCGALAAWFDQGRGERRWGHPDAGFAAVELVGPAPVGPAPRVNCTECDVTVAAVPWARHDSAFTRAFEDVVVHDAVLGNTQAAADRYGISWRAVIHMCVRVATEALGRIDLLDGLVAIAIYEVKSRRATRT